MFVNCVTVYVKPDKIGDFIRATVENHQGSIKEPGNLRFDFLRCAKEEGRFFLYEAWETEDAASAHKLTPHYMKWRDTVAGWMARPREGVAHTAIEPSGKGAWKI